MYGMTKPVPASEFSRMPDKFRKKRRSSWADANAAGMELESFLEGPSFDRAGNLYVTDIPFGRIFRISPAGEWTLVTEYDGWPNGLKIHGRPPLHHRLQARHGSDVGAAIDAGDGAARL